MCIFKSIKLNGIKNFLIKISFIRTENLLESKLILKSNSIYFMFKLLKSVQLVTLLYYNQFFMSMETSFL